MADQAQISLVVTLNFSALLFFATQIIYLLRKMAEQQSQPTTDHHQRHLSNSSSNSTISYYPLPPPPPPPPLPLNYYQPNYLNYHHPYPFTHFDSPYRTPHYHQPPPPPPPLPLPPPSTNYNRRPHTPIASQKPHWKYKPHSPRNIQPFSPRSPYSSTSSPSTQAPLSPATPQQPLVRGSLAQAKLRGHHHHPTLKQPPQHIPFANLSIHHHHNNNNNKQLHPNTIPHSTLPKPPIHSLHALWVGNIPNDASHEELWKFFSNQVITPQHLKLAPSQNLSSTNPGVESIHLIARSNCAFVNYSSQAHLSQAITACNGKPLRPLDPYCKPLLCRIRKPEDNIKSGVGAQRIGGMHRSWIKRSQQQPPHHYNHINKHRHTLPSISQPPKTRENHSNSYNTDPTNLRTSSTLTAVSNQSQSTTSSFLTNHFPRRYFILKAYTDEDLRISVERSIWVSQTHNEPVLDQAYRSSSEGVYLIFSANQSGEFFGYARMAGPIGVSGRRVSLPTSPAAQRGTAARTRSASIGAADRPTEGLFGLADVPTSASPRALSPVESPDRPLRWPGSPVRRSLPILGVARRDPPSSTSPALPTLLDHTSIHSTRSPCENSDDDDDSSSSSVSGKLMTGRPFKNLRNPFNGNREVKVSRDGTEVEPSIGQAILTAIDNQFFRQNNIPPSSQS
ncbi:hypothetical protein VP01_58g6 [Puccinia sorghi]|uniref:YTH domain-containing protein n=1 Tax=Puccinia sorghi TaxID=27349 RepID=A0A0L6UHW1_9BASI|nr:hypothetical protein VP01_58g6 [Puccinia sorghi]